MSNASHAPESDDQNGRIRTYERPDPPFFQRHPVIIIVLASLSLMVTLSLVFFVL